MAIRKRNRAPAAAHPSPTPSPASSREDLARKCTRAMQLLEQARELLCEVIDDPAYQPEGVLPRGVCAEDAANDAEAAIGWLTPFTAEEHAEADRDDQQGGQRHVRQ